MAIHRFKCSPALNEEIQSFSRKYMFNNDADLSDNFEEWYNKPNIATLVNIEEGFLSQHDYDVPIKHKIYRSIKYYYIKKFISRDVIKSKVLSENQLEFLKNIMGTWQTSKLEKLELIYKHFNDFKDPSPIKEVKTKNFTIKFKEKLNKLI